MGIHLNHAGRRLLVAALVLLSTAALAATAVAGLAGKPEKGKTYKGVITRATTSGKITYPISFKVSKTGKSVGHFKLPDAYPHYCSNAGGFGDAMSVRAPISRRGTFTAKLPIIFTPTHSKEGFLKITGKFGRKGHEQGQAITDFTRSKSCNGKSPYSTKAG